MSERLKKTPVWHKVFGVIETLALAACATGERIGLVTPPPEGTATNPAETVPPPLTETIPTSAVETATATSVEFLGQDEVLATKLSETQTLANLFAKFEEDTQVKALFTDPAGIEYSAMGIKAFMAESGRTIIYPFFSAMSETEKKGYTTMVLQPSAEEVVYQVLNRITDAEGKVGLGITQDLNHQLLEKPVMIFATGLTTDQIAKMTDEELSQINLLFVPAGLPVSPSEAPLGVGNYLASLKPVEPTPTPEATAEAIFVPEGFAIAEGGLLRNPETGENVIAMNPEADWKRVREEIIGGLWEANVDWYKFTGEGSDALNYSKENFIKAAIEGKVFRIGIPVRANVNWDNFDKERDPFTPKTKPSLLELKMVEARFDDIKIQILDPDAFKNYLGGKDWYNSDMEVFAPYAIPDSSCPINAVHFSVDNDGRLIISTGSYYFKDSQPVPEEFWVGRFNSEKGIGSQADRAVTLFLGETMAELEYFSAGELKVTGLDGTIIKFVGLSRIEQDVLWEKWYLLPQLLIFGK